MLLSVEVRSKIADNQIQHSYVELISKDSRKINVILSDHDACLQVKEYIKHFAHLDKMVQERQFQSMFAKIFYN